jgi:alkanesulfonate monooxygenase SsuD/methylene tetrahydromethanopterin reductase-like flavin-dependent oxidoreductase (luciferase family)
MKCNFFHLMPYPYLPDDFDERYASPSLNFPNKHFDRETGHRLYHRYLDELEYADRLGFDGIVVNEHHQSAYGLMPAPNLMAAALARRTSRARIMILGNAIGIRDHPLRVAEEIAMLDHLSDGRIVSGFVRGIGWEYFAHGISPARSRARFDEAHDLIIKAWTSDEVFQWISPNYEFRYVNVWPRPLQEPHPPVYIPGAGSTETMRFVAEHGYTYMSVFAPTRVVKHWFDGYRTAAHEAGLEPDPEKIVLTIPIYVAEDDETAHREARPAVEWLFHKGLKQSAQMVVPPGYMSPGSLRGVLEAGMKAFPETSYEELLEGGFVVVGSADSVGEQLEALRDELGFGGLNAQLTFGSMTHYQAIKSMELFATEIMPALRGAGAEPQPAIRTESAPIGASS